MIPLYYSVRSLAARRLSTTVTVLGLALVVFVFAAVLMLAAGVERALAAGGSPDNVVLLREGATAELVSAVDRSAVRAVSTFPEVATAPDGRPLAVGELVVIVALPRGEDAFVNATARGVAAESWPARPAVRLVEGRPPRPGADEVAIGNALVGRTDGAFVGGQLRLFGRPWRVVGRLTADGSAFESELWFDERRLAEATRRDTPSSALVHLRSAAAVEPFLARLAADPRFALKAVREDRYWEELAAGTATFVRVLGLFVSVVFAIGAALGAMITMYAQVAARVRELGTLRALGFRRRSVLAAVVVEGALLGAAGGLAGAAAALALGLVRLRTLNFQTFSEVRFAFAPTPGILVASLLFGAAMGLAGGLLPAVRAARLDILDALRGR